MQEDRILHLSAALSKAGYAAEPLHRITDHILDTLEESGLPAEDHKLYDIPRSLRIIARREFSGGEPLTEDHLRKARDMVLKAPNTLLDVVGLTAEFSTATKLPRRIAKNPEPTGVGPISLEQVKQAIRDHVENTGSRPSEISAKVEHGDLAGKITWAALNQRLKTGKISNEDGKTVIQIAEKMGYKSKSQTKFSKADLDGSILAHYDALGERPTIVQERVKYGPLKAYDLTWLNVSSKVSKGQITDLEKGTKFSAYRDELITRERGPGYCPETSETDVPEMRA